jgi:hypothetical protein
MLLDKCTISLLEWQQFPRRNGSGEHFGECNRPFCAIHSRLSAPSAACPAIRRRRRTGRRNPEDIFPTSRLPTVDLAPPEAAAEGIGGEPHREGEPVSTTTLEQATWICPNCTMETRAPRKRCRDCGTSRW